MKFIHNKKRLNYIIYVVTLNPIPNPAWVVIQHKYFENEYCILLAIMDIFKLNK